MLQIIPTTEVYPCSCFESLLCTKDSSMQHTSVCIRIYGEHDYKVRVFSAVLRLKEKKKGTNANTGILVSRAHHQSIFYSSWMQTENKCKTMSAQPSVHISMPPVQFILVHVWSPQELWLQIRSWFSAVSSPPLNYSILIWNFRGIQDRQKENTGRCKCYSYCMLQLGEQELQEPNNLSNIETQ